MKPIGWGDGIAGGLVLLLSLGVAVAQKPLVSGELPDYVDATGEQFKTLEECVKDDDPSVWCAHQHGVGPGQTQPSAVAEVDPEKPAYSLLIRSIDGEERTCTLGTIGESESVEAALAECLASVTTVDVSKLDVVSVSCTKVGEYDTTECVAAVEVPAPSPCAGWSDVRLLATSIWHEVETGSGGASFIEMLDRQLERCDLDPKTWSPLEVRRVRALAAAKELVNASL